jgi:hypothetical protein
LLKIYRLLPVSLARLLIPRRNSPMSSAFHAVEKTAIFTH